MSNQSFQAWVQAVPTTSISYEAFRHWALAAPMQSAAAAGAVAVLSFVLLRAGLASRRSRTTKLRGPKRDNFLMGFDAVTRNGDDGALLYEQWAEQYGDVFAMPSALGSEKLVLTDPKALSHYFPQETTTYQHPAGIRANIKVLLGNGMLSVEDEDHRRQRKQLSPGFSNSYLREFSHVFTDAAWTTKSAWEDMIDSADGISVDVQQWMNRISIDSIGIAGLSYNFNSLGGQGSRLSNVIDAFGVVPVTFADIFVFVFSQFIPSLVHLPTSHMNLLKELGQSASVVGDELVSSLKKNDGVKNADKSILSVLMRGSDAQAAAHLTQDEINGQIRLLVVAGYETTSISMTWALIELARNQAAQQKLRDELQSAFPSSDPTWDQLNGPTTLPYLDAVCHEILRLHPAVPSVTREATRDDVLPLTTPVVGRDGQQIDRVAVAAGTQLTIPIRTLNRSDRIWGPDAKQFRPERWTDPKGLPEAVQELQGTRHLYTFIDGPRTCLGKGFAIAEFKAVMSVLVKNFIFDLPDGPETKIVKHQGSLIPRPKVEGEIGVKLPMKIRRVEM